VQEESQPGLEDSGRDLIPLPVATAVAYGIISNRPQRLADPRGLEESRSVIALALSALAPFYVLREGGAPVPLSSDEIERKIFFAASKGLRYRSGAPDIDRVYIKRGDFLRAVENLKTARPGFEQPPARN
jgi:hypothetical protein